MTEPELHWKNQKDHYRLSLQFTGEDVSRVWGLKLCMRVGSVRVRIGGITNVETPEKHRLKGYSSRAMWAAIEMMEDNGYDMSVLFGIPDFYHRFGYAAVFPESWLYVKTQDLLRAEARYAARLMRRKNDLPELLQLYNHNHAERTGTLVRPKTWRCRRPWPLDVIVALDARKRVVGYLKYLKEDERFKDDRPDGVDIEAWDDSVFGTLAAALGRRARRRDVSEVRFWLPPDHSFGAFCAGLGCRWEIYHTPKSKAMGRIICLERLMKKLTPELGRRLEAAESSWKGELSLVTDIGVVGLEVDGRGVQLRSPQRRNASVIEIPQMALTQLVMGYRSVDDVSRDPGVTIPARLVPVMEALFPKGQPYMAHPDRF